MKVKNLKIGEKVIVKSLPSDPYFGVNVGDTVTIDEENSSKPWCKKDPSTRTAINIDRLKRIKKPKKNHKVSGEIFIDHSGELKLSIMSEDNLETPVSFFNSSNTEAQPKDQGAHYRKYHRVKLTDIDVERGFTEIQLDPFRLSSILGITDAAAFTVFKKSIRWGGSNAKDLKTDLKDIISACERKLEIIEEDEG